MNYYPFHIGDFRSGTVNMSRHARWIYRDMLDVYYDMEKPLPLDFELLCDEIGVESEEERRIVERLLRFKFIKAEDGYRHEICDRVIAEYHAKAETARANGKQGGRPRKQPALDEKPSGFQSGFNQDATSNQEQTGSQANQEPITNNHKPGDKPKNKKAQPSALPVSVLVGMGIPEQVVNDWYSIRSKKRLPLTQTALDEMLPDVEKAGMTLEAAIRLCCKRGWAGFESDWVSKPQARGSPPYQDRQEKRRAWADEITGANRERDDNIIDIN